MLIRTRFRVSLGAILALASGSVCGADWPQWLGPDRNGISVETGLLQEWPASGPKMLWQVPLGAGFSPVSVAEDRVITMVQDKAGQHVAALDEQSGKRLWKTIIGPSFMAGIYSGARSAPTIDGKFVYAIDAAGNTACLKVEDGAVIWKVNILELAGAQNLKWAFSAAPFISGDLLLVNAGTATNQNPSIQNVPPRQEGSSILALDKRTGKIIWKALNEEASYSTPMEFRSGSVDQFVFLTRLNVVGVARKDGKLLWSYPYAFKEKNNNIATPVIDGDMIFVGSAYNTGCMALRVDLKKNPPVRQVWKNMAMQPHFATPVLLDGYLYGYDMDKLVCVDFKTGEKMWSDSTLLKGQLIYADGLFYIYSERGILGLARLTPHKCEVISSVELLPGTQRWAMPVVANGRLYVRDDMKLLCLEVAAK